MTQRITFNGSRDDVRRIARSMALTLAGKQDDRQQVAYGFLLSMGFAALGSIKTAFVTKARGGTDEMGIKWKPLSRNYLLYGRRTSAKELAGIKRKAKAEGKKVKQQVFDDAYSRFSVSMTLKEAKQRATALAARAGQKAEGEAKRNLLATRQVEILRDTGVLLNSLSPGVIVGNGPSASYSKPKGEGGEEQVFDVAGGRVIVGTNVPYAAVHNFGSEKQGIPRRQYLPDDESQIPEAWWNRWLSVGMKALEVGTAQLYKRGAA